MNRTFTPVLIGAQIQGTGMKHPRVPRVFIGSEQNGFVQGDLMDANMISQYVADKIHSISPSHEDFDEISNKVTSLQEEDVRISSLIEEVVSNININIDNLGTDLNTRIQDLENRLTNHINTARPTVNNTGNGDLMIVFS